MELDEILVQSMMPVRLLNVIDHAPNLKFLCTLSHAILQQKKFRPHNSYNLWMQARFSFQYRFVSVSGTLDVVYHAYMTYLSPVGPKKTLDHLLGWVKFRVR